MSDPDCRGYNLSDEMKKKIFFFFISLLILAAVCTNYGLWNTDIPLGDEAGYVGTSFGMYQNSNWSSNIYYDTYILIFKYIDIFFIIWQKKSKTLIISLLVMSV